MVSQMSLSAAALWGFLGAAAIELWDLYGAIHRVKGLPWQFEGEVGFGPYLVSVVLRVLLGVGVAVAFVASGQVTGPVGAVAVGIAAPKVLEQLARHSVDRTTSEQRREREEEISSEAERLGEARKNLVSQSTPHGVSDDVVEILAERRRELAGDLLVVRPSGEEGAAS